MEYEKSIYNSATHLLYLVSMTNQMANVWPNIVPIPYYSPPPAGPKSGRPVYRTFDWGWIVIAYETGPLKLLEIERK